MTLNNPDPQLDLFYDAVARVVEDSMPPYNLSSVGTAQFTKSELDLHGIRMVCELALITSHLI